MTDESPKIDLDTLRAIRDHGDVTSLTVWQLNELEIADLAQAEQLDNLRQRKAMREDTASLPRAYSTIPSGSVPPHMFTRYLSHIERMAYQGLHVAQIAMRFGTSEANLRDHADKFADVRLALEGGLARGADELSASTMRSAVTGNTPAAALMLKSKHGYSDKAESGPSVMIAIGSNPAPVQLEHTTSMAERQRALLQAPLDQSPEIAGEVTVPEAPEAP